MEELSDYLKNKYIDKPTEEDELFIILSKHTVHYTDIRLVEFDIETIISKGTRVCCNSTNFFLRADDPSYKSDIEILKAALYKKRIKV